ncbi:unnamed protein product [Pedinophyceae sp. YPF-701]|nr:unnamed protein product [Pedinophyceae sp. YPF-701]
MELIYEYRDHFQANLAAQKQAAAASHTEFPDNAPSWEELEALFQRRCSDTNYREPWGYPTPDAMPHANPKQKVRTFGAPAAEAEKCKFYRDFCCYDPDCQRVWLYLEARRIPHTVQLVGLRHYGGVSEELKQAGVPNGAPPAIKLDGTFYYGIDRILEALDSKYPENTCKKTAKKFGDRQLPVLPPLGDPLRDEFATLRTLHKDLKAAWIRWLCSAEDASQVAAWKAQFEESLDELVATLEAANDGVLIEDEAPREAGWGAPGPFFLGAKPSLLDYYIAPDLERMAASLAYYKGYQLRGAGLHAPLDAWFAAMEGLPSYLGTRSDAYAIVHHIRPTLGGCGETDEGDAEQIRAAIDGKDGHAWKLPLPPVSQSVGIEPYAPGDHPAWDMLEAASRMLANREHILPFCCRGMGEVGEHKLTAHLSDPTAQPAMEFAPDVDAAMRHVTHLLLLGDPGAKQASDAPMFPPSTAPRGERMRRAGAAAVCLAYLRDRVGVPRDLTYPGARQLRAHLNWAIDQLLG